MHSYKSVLQIQLGHNELARYVACVPFDGQKDGFSWYQMNTIFPCVRIEMKVNALYRTGNGNIESDGDRYKRLATYPVNDSAMML